MKLLLLRHAQAVVGGDLDPDRVLTPVGERQAAAMASGLSVCCLEPVSLPVHGDGRNKLLKSSLKGWVLGWY